MKKIYLLTLLLLPTIPAAAQITLTLNLSAPQATVLTNAAKNYNLMRAESFTNGPLAAALESNRKLAEAGLKTNALPTAPAEVDVPTYFQLRAAEILNASPADVKTAWMDRLRRRLDAKSAEELQALGNVVK